MIEKSMSKKSFPYKIDLTEIEGDGSFSCPKCGTVISPDDETEQVYKIVKTKLINNELVELVIMCGNCGSKIKLTGFGAPTEGLPTI
jgi:predicted RNA-binding Zn-ribbon protein involved in translation (DUF1610 family)